MMTSDPQVSCGITAFQRFRCIGWAAAVRQESFLTAKDAKSAKKKGRRKERLGKRSNGNSRLKRRFLIVPLLSLSFPLRSLRPLRLNNPSPACRLFCKIFVAKTPILFTISFCTGHNRWTPMKVMILCGGLGTRLREETEFRPKPMVEIGGRPVLWHIMKLFAHYGQSDFILCLGYRGNMIKDYFLNYEARAPTTAPPITAPTASRASPSPWPTRASKR
jgi:hypothetical protein